MSISINDNLIISDEAVNRCKRVDIGDRADWRL